MFIENQEGDFWGSPHAMAAAPHLFPPHGNYCACLRGKLLAVKC